MLDKVNKIAFIGAGNMAQAIIDGLINAGVAPSTLMASDNSPDALAKISERFAIETGSNEQACNNADVILLAVKPQVLKSVCEEIKPAIPASALVISIAAGITCSSIENWLGQCALVRCMPNTPAGVGMGASGLYANSNVSQAQKEAAKHILGAVGSALYVDEEALLDAVTAVSGSGPAYYFLFTEAIKNAGIKLGLTEETSIQLALQTALGASTLASKSELSLEQLRKNVTSPNGTTEQAILSFENNNLGSIVEKAMIACAERAKTLSEELGE